MQNFALICNISHLNTIEIAIKCKTLRFNAKVIWLNAIVIDFFTDLSSMGFRIYEVYCMCFYQTVWHEFHTFLFQRSISALFLGCKDVLELVSMERTVINGVHITARQVTVTLWRGHVWAVFRVTRDQHAMNVRYVLKWIW